VRLEKEVMEMRLSVVMKVKFMFKKTVMKELKTELKKHSMHCGGSLQESRQPRRSEPIVCRTCPSGIGARSV
jgi:hypothetical protein